MAKTATTKTTATPSTTAQSAAPTEAKETKMARAKPLFEKVMGMTEEERGGKTPRRLFMDLAAEQLGMKAAGANTYFQNLKNEAETGDRYKYTPSSKAAPVGAAGVNPDAPATQGQVQQLGTQISKLNRQLTKMAKLVETTAAHA